MNEYSERLPLTHYCSKLNKREPFASLLYGDGEFRVLLGEKKHHPFTEYRELIDARLEKELLDSFQYPPRSDYPIYRGTDLNLIYYRDYQGGDGIGFKELGARIESMLAERLPERRIGWVDGTVWEESVQRGELGPLIQIMRKRQDELVIVGNKHLQKLAKVLELSPRAFVAIPTENAWGSIDLIYRRLTDYGKSLYVICIGLGAIPLIMRLLRYSSDSTFLDLGSTFDMFVGIGKERGWRADLYKDQTAHADLIDRNMRGSYD